MRLGSGSIQTHTHAHTCTRTHTPHTHTRTHAHMRTHRISFGYLCAHTLTQLPHSPSISLSLHHSPSLSFTLSHLTGGPSPGSPGNALAPPPPTRPHRPPLRRTFAGRRARSCGCPLPRRPTSPAGWTPPWWRRRCPAQWRRQPRSNPPPRQGAVPRPHPIKAGDE